MKYMSEFTAAEREIILREMVERLRIRVRVLQCDLEIAKTGRASGGGISEVNGTDRLMNRLTADLVLSDNGIPDHDVEALAWVDQVLSDANKPR